MRRGFCNVSLDRRLGWPEVEMKRIWQTILVIGGPFCAPALLHAATTNSDLLRIFDVTKVVCESGAKPDFYRVFPAGAVVKMKQDVVDAFAKAGDDRDRVILRYPIAKDGLDPSAPPPCRGGDVLIIELKKHLAVSKDIADQEN
jgi:hypothetical protein